MVEDFEGAQSGEAEAPAEAGTQRFMTLEDVAAYLNVSVPQVYALVRSGELAAIKIGGRGVWRVDRQRLDDYIERKHEETADWARSHPLSSKDRS